MTMSKREAIDAADRVWQAMLAIFPSMIDQDLKHAQGCPHLCFEHARALVHEWKKVRILG